jgi:hypothetical protein
MREGVRRILLRAVIRGDAQRSGRFLAIVSVALRKPEGTPTLSIDINYGADHNNSFE